MSSYVAFVRSLKYKTELPLISNTLDFASSLSISSSHLYKVDLNLALCEYSGSTFFVSFIFLVDKIIGDSYNIVVKNTPIIKINMKNKKLVKLSFSRF
jgi:hypothetical protein